MQRRIPVIVLLIPLGLLCWLGMMAVHEFGHMLHAWISGGVVINVVLHPLEISRTDVSPNPNPAFVAWGGLVWGSVIPLIAFLAALRWFRSAEFYASISAGFCLIANGVYFAAGSVSPVGDTRVLRSLGTSPAVFAVAGLPIAALGLYVWHRLDAAVSAGTCAVPATVKHGIALTTLLAITALLEIAVSN